MIEAGTLLAKSVQVIKVLHEIWRILEVYFDIKFTRQGIKVR